MQWVAVKLPIVFSVKLRIKHMEEIGDYLYLVVIIIAAVSSFLKKRKKAVQKANEEREFRPVVEEPEMDADDWWNTTIEPEPVKPEPIKSVKDYFEIRDNLKGYESTANVEEVKVKKQNISTVNFKETVAEAVVESDSNYLEINLNEVEEAKRAFVYSEVFARKY